MTSENWIFNFGFSLGLRGLTYIGTDIYYIPPIRLSFDKNTPMGDKGLPFFFGGIVGYTGWGATGKYSHHHIPLGLRFGYHFNFGVDNLDVYAVASAGWKVYFMTGDKKYTNDKIYKRANPINLAEDLFVGLNIGARYFVSDGFGFWAEAGYIGDLSIDIGLAFKL